MTRNSFLMQDVYKRQGMKLQLPKRWKLRRAGKRKKNPKRRIMVKKIIFCVLAVAITGVPAVFLNTIYGYLPGIVVVLGIAISYGYLHILKRTLTFTELSDLSNCERGTQVEFSVRIKSRFFLVYPKLELYFYISDLDVYKRQHDQSAERTVLQ